MNAAHMFQLLTQFFSLLGLGSSLLQRAPTTTSGTK